MRRLPHCSMSGKTCAPYLTYSQIVLMWVSNRTNQANTTIRRAVESLEVSKATVNNVLPHFRERYALPSSRYIRQKTNHDDCFYRIKQSFINVTASPYQNSFSAFTITTCIAAIGDAFKIFIIAPLEDRQTCECSIYVHKCCLLTNALSSTTMHFLGLLKPWKKQTDFKARTDYLACRRTYRQRHLRHCAARREYWPMQRF